MSKSSTSGRHGHFIHFLHKHGVKLRFLMAGAFNTLIGLLAYPFLYLLLTPHGVNYMLVLVITYVITVTVAFLTNKFFVFRTVGNHLREFGKFVTFYLAHFTVNIIALPILVEIVKMNPLWAQLVFAGMVIVSSYFWHRHITFAKRKSYSS